PAGRLARAAHREHAPPMSAIALLLGLLVLSYMGGIVRGGRAIQGFGLPSGAEYLCLGFVFGSDVLGLIPEALWSACCRRCWSGRRWAPRSGSCCRACTRSSPRIAA